MIRKKGKLYLSVKEYAEQAQVSQQAVYKQLNTRLAEFTIEEGDQKYIDAECLEKFYGSEGSTEVVKLEQLEVEREREHTREVKDQLESMIELLKNELDQKNKQIEDLSERLREANESLSQEQKLHLVTQQRLVAIEKLDDPAAEDQNQEEAAAEDQNQENQEEAAAEDQKKIKKGIFKKLFK